MGFRLYDAGKGIAGTNGAKRRDCQVRALCVAGGYTYQKAWDILYALQGQYRSMGFDLCLYLDKGELNVKRHLSFPAKKGCPRMTGDEFCRRYPNGSFILHQAHHVVAVEDGVVIDKFDTTRRCVYEAWELGKSSQRP